MNIYMALSSSSIYFCGER